jgi:hypothetical protein
MTWGLTAGILATLGATHADAQRWGRQGTPRSGACFYRDANFEGDYFCVAAGESIEALPNDMNDQISSIRTFGGAEVTVYQNRRFGGRSERFGDVRNLQQQGWNDRLSSLQVESRGGFSGRDRDRDRGFGNRDRDFGNGGFRNNGNAERIVRRAYQDVLDREPDEQGMRTYRSRIIDDGWTEEQVREALRRSPEYRERSTMTPQRAQEIVRRAYLSVLNREPDEASRGYVERVLRDKWTEEDVARELRRSPEYRQRGR